MQLYTNEKFALLNETAISNMQSADLVVLQFRAETLDGWREDSVARYELAIADFYTK